MVLQAMAWAKRARVVLCTYKGIFESLAEVAEQHLQQCYTHSSMVYDSDVSRGVLRVLDLCS